VLFRSLDSLAANLHGTVARFDNAYASATMTYIAVPTLVTGVSPLASALTLHSQPTFWEYQKALGRETFFFTSQSQEWENIKTYFTIPQIDHYFNKETAGIGAKNDLGIDDHYVVFRLSELLSVTLVVVLTIVLTSMLIRNVGQAAGGNVAPQDVVLLMGYATLSSLAPILALSLFVAVILTLGRLYRESEMTIWFASGIPLSSFVKPVLGMAWPVLLAVIVLELIVWPWGNRNSAELLDQYQKRGDLSRVAPGQFQTSRDGSRVFFIERGEDDAATGRNVFILWVQIGRAHV